MSPHDMVQQVSALIHPLINSTIVTSSALQILLAIRLVTSLQGLRRELGREDTEATESQHWIPRLPGQSAGWCRSQRTAS